MKLLADHAGKPSLTRFMAAACIGAAIVMAITWQWHVAFVGGLPTNTDGTTTQIILYLLGAGFGGKVLGAGVEAYKGQLES